MMRKAWQPPSNACSAIPICARPARAAVLNARSNLRGLRRRAACDAPTKTLSSPGGSARRCSRAHSRASTVEMRIGIDARELCGKPTGVGRHLAGLLRAWSADAAATRHTFVLYAHQEMASPFRHAELRVIPGSPGTMWEQRALPRATKQDRLDVFFAPGYTAPLLLEIADRGARARRFVCRAP